MKNMQLSSHLITTAWRCTQPDCVRQKDFHWIAKRNKFVSLQ